MKTDSKYILSESPIVCFPSLAEALGIDRAIIVQQIRYWMNYNAQDPNKKDTHFINGRWWTYNTLEQWENNFPWMRENTIGRHIKELVKQGIVLRECFHPDPRNRTPWYSIDFDRLDQVVEKEIEYNQKDLAEVREKRRQRDKIAAEKRKNTRSHQLCEMRHTDQVRCATQTEQDLLYTETSNKDLQTKTTKDRNTSHPAEFSDSEDPSLNTANAVRISQDEISLNRHEEKTSTSSTGDKDLSTKARRTQKPEEPNRTSKSSTSLKDQKQATRGNKSIGEDKKRGDFSPKKEKDWDWVGNSLYEFDGRGVVVLPSDGASKLPCALALKRMQIWLYEEMPERAACELARVGNEVWGRDEKDTDWAELKPVGQMLSYAEKYYEAHLIDDFNIAAVEALKTAQAWCAEFGSRAPVMAQKLGIAEIFGLDWIEDLEDEDDDADEAVELEDEYDVIPF